MGPQIGQIRPFGMRSTAFVGPKYPGGILILPRTATCLCAYIRQLNEGLNQVRPSLSPLKLYKCFFLLLFGLLHLSSRNDETRFTRDMSDNDISASPKERMVDEKQSDSFHEEIEAKDQLVVIDVEAERRLVRKVNILFPSMFPRVLTPLSPF
jgi:hypothetical protein